MKFFGDRPTKILSCDRQMQNVITDSTRCIRILKVKAKNGDVDDFSNIRKLIDLTDGKERRLLAEASVIGPTITLVERNIAGVCRGRKAENE